MPETTNRQPDNRSRRLFAAITAAATLMILWVLYDSEFLYADTAKGQMEAARSLGLSYGKAMRKVILPQAFRTMLPTIINQFIISLKDTSLISVIGPRELTQNSKIIAANASSMVMPIYLSVAIFYLVICTILSRVAKYVERRVSYGK